MSVDFLPGYDAWKTREPESDQPPMVACPKCRTLHDDFDGLGFVHCHKCGHCTHEETEDGWCLYCGTEICDDCHERKPVEGENLCPDCRDNRAEAAWERMQEDGETFRGGEAEAFRAEQQARIQRELK